MPPRISPDAGRGRGGRGGFRGGGDRGAGRGDRGMGRGSRGGDRGGERGGWRGGERGGRGGFRGDSRGRPDRGAGRGRSGAPRGRGRGRGAPPGLPPAGGGTPPPLPAAHVQAIGVPRPGYGTRGYRTTLESNYVELKLDGRMIYHYDVILPEDERRPIERNFQIITELQFQVEARLAAQPGAYDGRKNFFTSFDLEFESGSCEYVVPLGSPSLVEGGPPPQEFRVRLTRVSEINPEVLQQFVNGNQSHDEAVLTAITAYNIVARMEPSLRYPSRKNSFFTSQGERPIGGGIVLWPGYFQSIRPAIERMLINVDTVTGVMFRSGKLIDLALDFLGKQSPNALAPQRGAQRGLPDRERLRLQQFLSGAKVTTPYRTQNPDRKRTVKKVTRESARDRTFELGDGETMTVLDYFQNQLNIQLQHPDVVCVELSSGAVIPLELCQVPPGQLARKHLSQDQTNSILQFSTKSPRERKQSVENALGVLQYGQSQYIQQFGMDVSNTLISLEGRILDTPTVRYNPSSRRPTVQPENGTWNLIDKLMFNPVDIPNWIVLIYERQHRFRQEIAGQMITGFVTACRAVGITINHQPTLVRWESGQGNVTRQLRAACDECQRVSRALPSLIVVILPEGGNDIYTTVKHFGDVSAGVATQCMKASKCFRAKPQYYANVTLKVNVKLGGINAVADPRDISFLTDTINPAMILGADITHAPPGSKNRPSFASVVGSVDANAAKYVSRISVQASHRELIEDMENMCTYVFEQYRTAMGKFPKRILLYRDGVSEGEFSTIISEELGQVRKACAKLGFEPTITLIVVGKYHKVVFFPTADADADRSGNCPAGTVVDTTVTSPVEFDYYLFGHAGLLGTSKPAHYNVLLDENDFTPDGIQALSFALCHVYARCTRSVSVPAPVYYAHNVCERAKNHYDPQQGQQLFDSEIATETGAESSASVPDREYQIGFRQTHERMARTMYFC